MFLIETDKIMGMIEFTEEEFNKIKSSAEELYKNFGKVRCPFLQSDVSFTAAGLEHIKFKRRDKARLEKDQYMRFKLLYLAPEILKSSHTLQGIQETKKFERVRMNNRTENVLKPIIYYEFIAVIKRNRVRIIIKQIDDGQKFFWSIVPFWGMNTETITRILHDGVPEED